MHAKKIIIFIILVLVPLAVGFGSSFFVSSNQAEEYANFIQPSFAPPGWVFGPVWTILYILMGTASYLVYVSDKDKRAALIIYGLQLFFNFLWTIIFFGWRRYDLASIEIIVLWVLILANIVLFARVRKAAAWLLVPYILWVSFAAVLNAAIWQLN